MAVMYEPDTCSCVQLHESAPPYGLISFVRKCPFHAAMSDQAAFDEMRTAHKQRADVARAKRRAILGTEDLSAVDGNGEKVVPVNHPARIMNDIKLVPNDAGTAREVVVEKRGWSDTQLNAIRLEAAKVQGALEVKVDGQLVVRAQA